MTFAYEEAHPEDGPFCWDGKYLNYGECEICHKKADRLCGANICMDCFDKYLEEISNENTRP